MKLNYIILVCIELQHTLSNLFATQQTKTIQQRMSTSNFMYLSRFMYCLYFLFCFTIGIKEYSNWPTIPQVFINGEFVGGCDILLQLHQSGELIEELQKAGIKSALIDAKKDKAEETK